MIAMSKAAYLVIVECSATKPVIIFMSSHCQCRLTVDGILTHCIVDGNPDGCASNVGFYYYYL